MSDYSELVKALRCVSRYKNFTKDCNSQNPNELCRYCHHWICEDDRIFADAASAIEALWSENDILHAHIEDMNELFRDKSIKIEELQAAIELMRPYMPDFFSDANKVVLPKMEAKE